MNDKRKEEDVDVAVVGGGVSGLYSAWRLCQPGTGFASVAVFEASDRVGGRLWSVGMDKERAIPAELGGMFFSDSQALVYRLITEVLQLKRESVAPYPDFAYLRRKRFLISRFKESGVPPYRLSVDEQGKSYHELLFLALHRIVPDLDAYWPLDKSGTPTALVEHLREVEFENRKLHQWGFWNLLAKVLSNEAYLCLRDLVGSFAMFSNWNGYDAALSLLWDLTGSWFRIPDGYEQLPRTLARQVEENGAAVHRDSRALSIEKSDDGPGLLLHIHSKEGQRRVRAKSVILALPKQAIRDLHWGNGALADGGLQRNLDAIEGVPACKIFLTFDQPWWRDVPDGPGRIEDGAFGLSHTDLPMRQCYYLGVDPDTGEGLMLASYSDAGAVPFWSCLVTESGQPSPLRSEVSKAALQEIRRQLSEMHGVEVPAPSQGIFVNWAAQPYGGGWHAWLPGWKSYDVMASLRRPFPGINLHVCGEVSCANEGWVEGALTSAEVMLQEQFGLAEPGWFDSSHALSPYKT